MNVESCLNQREKRIYSFLKDIQTRFPEAKVWIVQGRTIHCEVAGPEFQETHTLYEREPSSLAEEVRSVLPPGKPGVDIDAAIKIFEMFVISESVCVPVARRGGNSGSSGDPSAHGWRE